jgi:CDP-glucose 4,6-dehydratase
VGRRERSLEGLVSGGVTDRITGMDDLFAGAFKRRRVFVTGHTGFKGSWLTEWLLELGAEVTGYALDPPTTPSLFDELGLDGRIRHVFADVRDLDRLLVEMAASRPEVVFHLAAQPLVRQGYAVPVETFETNVMGTVNVLEAARGCAGLRALVNVTSDKCYENHETVRPYVEADPMGGFDPYSCSKGCSELVTAAYRRSFFAAPDAAVIASARAGNVIGGGDWAADRIVPDCVRALAASRPIEVRNPEAVRPWQHVLEPLSGYLWLAARMLEDGHALDGAWNFGPDPGEVVPVGHVADAVVAGWGSGSWFTPESSVPQPHEAGLLLLDISKARAGLGWRPTWSTERALAVTADWYRARHEDTTRVPELVAADIAAYMRDASAAGAVWVRAR